jgi:LacI family transcriptional regulator
VLGNAHSDPEEALEISNVLDTRHCDGVIVLGDLKDDEAALPKILAGNRTAVALCRGHSPAWIPTINVNNSQGIRLLWQHLTDMGHQRFAFINGGWLGDIRERRTAFEGLLESWPVPGIIQEETDELEGGYRAMQSLLRQATWPTAVFAADDMMAIGALQAALDAGLQIPEDLSLVGFDDIEMAHFIHPRLTTICQPVEEMSRQALNWIMEMIAHKDHPLENRLFSVEPKLMIRESTGQAPADQ